MDCGLGCGRSTEECVTEIVGQVLAPLILATNVATMGLAAPVTNALQTITVAGKAVVGTSKLGKAFVKFANKLEDLRDEVGSALSKARVTRILKDPRTGKTLERIDDVVDVSSLMLEARQEYKDAFAEDFEAQTSTFINAEIEKRFTKQTADYIKGEWGMVEMEFLAEANAWNTAGLALLAASAFDPTGVTDAVAAFAKPDCFTNQPFPTTNAEK